MSLSLAQFMGYEIDSSLKPPLIIHMGNGRTVQTVGIVTTSYRIPDVRCNPFQGHFVVVNNLPFGVGLCSYSIKLHTLLEYGILSNVWVAKDHPHFFCVTVNSSTDSTDQSIRLLCTDLWQKHPAERLGNRQPMVTRNRFYNKLPKFRQTIAIL
jgi:hypothetical protein